MSRVPADHPARAAPASQPRRRTRSGRTPARALPAGAAPATEAPAVPTLGEIGLNHFAPYLLNRLSAQWNAELGALLDGLGLSTTQFRALAVLTVSSGITVNALALFAVTEQSTMSRTLDVLEEQALVRRRARAGDMRVREVFITEAGLALFGRIWPAVHATHARFFAGVEETEFRGFVATLTRVMRNASREGQ